MTVQELRARVSGAEFVGWSVYYGRKAQREEMERMKIGAGGG